MLTGIVGGLLLAQHTTGDLWTDQMALDSAGMSLSDDMRPSDEGVQFSETGMGPDRGAMAMAGPGPQDYVCRGCGPTLAERMAQHYANSPYGDGYAYRAQDYWDAMPEYRYDAGDPLHRADMTDALSPRPDALASDKMKRAGGIMPSRHTIIPPLPPAAGARPAGALPSAAGAATEREAGNSRTEQQQH